ncbi:TniQ family protein [Mesorhizobium sp. M0808]|uniref:TniQ family protein n=1 Tax=Mesorhizobium sp. M0808 TaxID=2957002 RepID=UPI0033373B5A
MIRELSGTRPLPVILKPVPDELLSSWITRHADFYGVAPLTMLRHAMPEATSLRQTDTNLGPTAAVGIARLFRTQPSTILAMTTSGFPKSAAQLVAPRAIQCCIPCCEQNRSRGAATAVQRSWTEGWRITCPVCRQRQQETREGSSALASTSLPFEDLWVDAVQGERLIDQSLTGASVGWVSPIDIVRLLLIRRCPKPVRHHPSIGRCTILGAVVPGFDELVAEQRLPRPTIARPILPIGLRMALLAGVSIVYQAGPTYVSGLKRQTLGAYYTRFAAIDARISVSRNSQSLQVN